MKVENLSNFPVEISVSNTTEFSSRISQKFTRYLAKKDQNRQFSRFVAERNFCRSKVFILGKLKAWVSLCTSIHLAGTKSRKSHLCQSTKILRKMMTQCGNQKVVGSICGQNFVNLLIWKPDLKFQTSHNVEMQLSKLIYPPITIFWHLLAYIGTWKGFKFIGRSRPFTLKVNEWGYEPL